MYVVFIQKKIQKWFVPVHEQQEAQPGEVDIGCKE